MTVGYQGPLLDYSGYGEANRHFVAALKAAGVDVHGELVAYSKERADYGTLGPIIAEALNNKQHYKIKIMHTTPDEFERLREPGKYHIAHFFWETDKIPMVFADGFQHVDEIWTGSQANKEAIETAGVTKPIHIIPQPTECEREWPAPYELPDFDGLLFYSIFEWTDRKNPQALLRAYYQEFKKSDNVGLLIKTYFRNFNGANKQMIRNTIASIQAEFGGPGNTPPVFLYLDLMDRQQIMRLHKTGEIFVSAHRGEGWGVPQVEAMLAGNLVISTGYGGVHEYLTDRLNALILPYSMQPVKGMVHSSSFYTPDQRWAEIDPAVLQKEMRTAYNSPKGRRKIAHNGTELVHELFNFKRIGGIMKARLEEIEATL